MVYIHHCKYKLHHIVLFMGSHTVQMYVPLALYPGSPSAGEEPGYEAMYLLVSTPQCYEHKSYQVRNDIVQVWSGNNFSSFSGSNIWVDKILFQCRNWQEGRSGHVFH